MTPAYATRRIIYIAGSVGVPHECAPTNRVINVAKALREAGYTVVFLPEEEQGRPEDVGADGASWYRGFQYVPVGAPRRFRVERTWRAFCGVEGPTVRWLCTQNPTEIAAVIMYGGYSGLYYDVLRWSRQQQIPMICDVVEYQEGWFLLRSCGLRAWLNYELRTRYLQTRSGRVIAISSHLERFYQARGCRVLRVLPLIDTQDPRWAPVLDRAQDERLRLLFVGSPDRDRMDLVLLALSQVAAQGVAIQLTFAGCSKPRFLALPRVSATAVGALGNHLQFIEWVPYAQLPAVIAQADYGLLFRPNQRCIRAGFPAKAPEMLTKGTPLLCNLTTDLGTYIHDGVNGLVVPELTAAALAATIHRAQELSLSAYLKMRANARWTAETHFDYRTMVAPLQAFLAQSADKPR